MEIGKTSSLVLTLSGVLKDILLVALSVIIWGTPVTALQLFGYAIALGGLIWYKLGGEQAQAAYMKLAGDENSTFNRFRRSLWAKVGAGLLVIFVVVAFAHGFARGKGIDTASTDIGLTGTPEPDMVEAYNHETHDPEAYNPEAYNHETYNPEAYNPEAYHPESYTPEGWQGDSHEFASAWDEIDPSAHYTADVVNEASAYSLDVVIYISPANSNNITLRAFEQLLALPGISSMNPRTTSYSASAPGIQITQQLELGRINSASAAFLDYISNHFESLAQHTIFLHTDVDAQHIASIIASRFQPRTGVAELSVGGYSQCPCLQCADSTHTHLTQTDELYALTSQDICTPQTRLLVLHLQLHYSKVILIF